MIWNRGPVLKEFYSYGNVLFRFPFFFSRGYLQAIANIGKIERT